MKNNYDIEVWGYKTFRPFRIYWMLKEYNLPYKSYKIGSRTGETKTKAYLSMNPKAKIPILKHNNNIIILINLKNLKIFLYLQNQRKKQN